MVLEAADPELEPEVDPGEVAEGEELPPVVVAPVPAEVEEEPLPVPGLEGAVMVLLPPIQEVEVPG